MTQFEQVNDPDIDCMTYDTTYLQAEVAAAVYATSEGDQPWV